MWLRRLGAAIAAIAVVIIAVVVRAAIDEGDGSPAHIGPGTVTGTSGPLVACLPELAGPCSEIGGVRVRVEPWKQTLDTIGTAEEPDAWVTFAPFDSMTRWSAPPASLAGSDLVIVTQPERADALVAGCAGAQLWTCIGNAAGGPWSAIGGQASWGPLRPGIDDPGTSTVGLLSLAAASTTFFGRADFTNRDLTADDAFADWFVRLVSAVPANATSDALTLLLQRPSALALAATTAQRFEASVGSRRAQFTATYPGPMARAEVVLAMRSAEFPAGALDRLRAALREAGWADAGSGASQLPSGATLVRLAELWREDR